MPGFYEVANWKEYQHYKDRNPPWVRLYYSLLTSETWVVSDDAGRALMVAVMLVASRNEGRIPSDPNYIRKLATLNTAPDFAPLVASGFLIDASNPLAGGVQGASTPLACSVSVSVSGVKESISETETEGASNMLADKPKPGTPKRKTVQPALAAESLYRYGELLAIYPPDKSKPDAEARRWWPKNADTDEKIDLILANTRVWLDGAQYRAGKGWNIGRYLSEGMVFSPPGKPAPMPNPEKRYKSDLQKEIEFQANEKRLWDEAVARGDELPQ